MKHVDVGTLVQAIPITSIREERLRRWANLCRESKWRLNLGHNLEYAPPYTRTNTPATFMGHSALSIAASDPAFNQQGLSPDASVQDVMNFFEISHQQLHEFSCDCGGHIDNENQARRIERLI